MIEFLGLIGMILIVLAWIPETLRTIKTKKVGMEPKFVLMYFFGCISLVIYSIYISDIIFMTLNSIALFFSLINLYYSKLW